jgi:hypothetical protein
MPNRRPVDSSPEELCREWGRGPKKCPVSGLGGSGADRQNYATGRYHPSVLNGGPTGSGEGRPSQARARLCRSAGGRRRPRPGQPGIDHLPLPPHRPRATSRSRPPDRRRRRRGQGLDFSPPETGARGRAQPSPPTLTGKGWYCAAVPARKAQPGAPGRPFLVVAVASRVRPMIRNAIVIVLAALAGFGGGVAGSAFHPWQPQEPFSLANAKCVGGVTLGSGPWAGQGFTASDSGQWCMVVKPMQVAP